VYVIGRPGVQNQNPGLSKGGGNERPLLSESLDAAPEFIKFFVIAEKALKLRAQLQLDKMGDALIATDEELAATFRNQQGEQK
jgi:hypothetical protein